MGNVTEALIEQSLGGVQIRTERLFGGSFIALKRAALKNSPLTARLTLSCRTFRRKCRDPEPNFDEHLNLYFTGYHSSN